MNQLAQLLINGIISGSLYALAAAGLALSYGLFRLLNFAHGHLMMIGAYLFLSCLSVGLSPIVALLLSLLLSVPIAALVLHVFILPFTKYNLVLALVGSLGLSIVLESIVSLIFGVNLQTIDAGRLSTVHQWGGTYITSLHIVIICSAIAIFLLMALVLQFTPAGRALRAIASNPEGAESLGINRERWIWRVFLFSTIVSVYAGILAGCENTVQPTMGSAYTIKAFAAMIVGGLGSVWGAVIGAYMLGLLENFSMGIDWGGWSLPAGYKDAFAYLLVLLVLLARPQGLFTRKSREV